MGEAKGNALGGARKGREMLRDRARAPAAEPEKSPCDPGLEKGSRVNQQYGEKASGELKKRRDEAKYYTP